MVKRLPVVMIHGAFCGGWAFADWRALYEAQGFEVHTPDLRHHSSYDEGQRFLAGVSMRDYCADVAAFLARFESPPVVVGHSLGGLVAQILAAQGRTRALILLAPLAPWGTFPSTVLEWMSMQALCWEGPFWKKALPPRHRVAADYALERVSAECRATILERLVPESGFALLESMHWFLDPHKATFVEPRDVTCPILCIAGARDRIVPPSTVRRIARRYGGRARYEILPDHGHWFHGEPGWERIAQGSLAWLNQVLDRNSKRVVGDR